MNTDEPGTTPEPNTPEPVTQEPDTQEPVKSDNLIGRARHRVETPGQLQAKDIATTGHTWDGIMEYDHPLPRWWLWTFYATIIWGIGYVIAYPAWPMVNSASAGLLGYSTRGELAEDLARVEALNAPMNDKLVAADLTMIATDPELKPYAVSAGAAVFRTYCSTCHGSGAAGVQASGYPNLLDDDWLWGGDIASIHATIAHGVRSETDPDTRFSQMPVFGEILEPAQIGQIVQHVLAISGQEHDAALATGGATLFTENCVACHGEKGEGNREFGAPNLTDAIWLYGGTPEKLTESVSNARQGMMLNWNSRLTEAQIRSVASYVHQLGGGE